MVVGFIHVQRYCTVPGHRHQERSQAAALQLGHDVWVPEHKELMRSQHGVVRPSVWSAGQQHLAIDGRVAAWTSVHGAFGISLVNRQSGTGCGRVVSQLDELVCPDSGLPPRLPQQPADSNEARLNSLITSTVTTTTKTCVSTASP